MFELLKLLVEKVVGQISFDAIQKRRKEGKLATIGSELMLLYLSLNDVIVIGEEILATLRKMAASKNVVIRKGILVILPQTTESKNEAHYNYCYAHELKMLVRFQAEQLVKVIASCHRLNSELGVIDETGGRVLESLLDIKFGLLRNQICELWPEIFDPRSGMTQLLRERKCLRSFEKQALDQMFALYDSLGGHQEFEKAWKAWNSGVQIPLDDQVHPDLARRFLDSGAEENLRAITESAQKLRDQIEKHFSITDVLLRVHDARSVTPNPEHILSEVWQTAALRRLLNK